MVETEKAKWHENSSKESPKKSIAFNDTENSQIYKCINVENYETAQDLAIILMTNYSR